MIINKPLVSGLIALVVFLCGLPRVYAQQNGAFADSSNVYELDEIIISAGKYEQSPESVGRNVTVITQKEIQQSAYTSVTDLLADQQSIHMVGSGQTPGSLQQSFIRNANSNHSIVMIDGVRISDPSTNNNAVDLSEISLTGVERIEIVRGSHSTLYGSSAIGGVVNIITEKRGAEGINLNLQTIHGSFGKGTYQTGNNLFLNYTTRDGFYANLGVDQQYTHGLDATIDTVSNPNRFNPQDQDDFRKLDVTTKIGFKNKHYDIYASYRREDHKVEVDREAYRDDSNAFTDFRRSLFSYGGSSSPSKNISFEFNGAYSALTRDFVNDSSLVFSGGIYDGIFVESNAEGSLWENELKGVFKGNHVRLVTGLSSNQQTMSTRNYVFNRSQYGIYENTTDLDSLNLKEVVYNGYVHAELEGGGVSESLEPFSLVLGGRYVNHDEFGSHFTYEINPNVQLSESILVYGAISTGFNAPSLYQLYSPSQGVFTNRGNKNLKPEKSVSYEIGWKQQVSPAFSFKLSAFNTKVRDVIEYVYLWNSNTSIGNLGYADYLGDTYINASDQNIRGFELSATASVTPRLNFRGNVSLTESTLTLDPGHIETSYTGGNHIQIYESGRFIANELEIEGLTRRPHINAFVSSRYKVLDGLELKVESRFVGARRDVFYSANLGPFGALDRREISSYNLTDFNVRYEITSELSVTGKVENVFNTDYQEINGYRTRGRGLYMKISFTL